LLLVQNACSESDHAGTGERNAPKPLKQKLNTWYVYTRNTPENQEPLAYIFYYMVEYPKHKGQ
jgi:hypothetical protein